MRPLTVYCESFGCQMNAYEGEVIVSLMEREGHRSVSTPEQADVIIVNTCSVREHAEARAIGRLHDLSRHRRAALVVVGCMAQRLGEELFEIVPSLRGIAGTAAYERLPAAIGDSLETGGRFSLLEMDERATYALPPEASGGGVCRYLTITMGCENYCSYCIVPYLRGRVRSKSPAAIIGEAAALCARGARDVTILGQNVVAYRHGDVDFLGLVRSILRETDVARLRFMTSHPKDVEPGIFELMAGNGRLCPHIHLPVQAGSNRILRLMNRGYTREAYLAIVRAAREMVPSLAMTTDVIVGFPTETDDDFRETLEIVAEARFDAAFTFKYSPREGTPASALPDDVPLDVKKERLEILNRAVTAVRGEVLSAQLGTPTEILLDGTVQKGQDRFWKGRTPHFRNAVVRGEHLKEGEILPVTLKRLLHCTFEADIRTSREQSEKT